MFASLLSTALSTANGRVYFIGIKGTGMCALAELLHAGGVRVCGSDRADVFYTDAILKELAIPYFESFESSHITSDIDLVVYSAAYSFETNPEMAAAQRRGLPMLKYTDALGAYSALFDSSGIAGVHGKTTTTALCGALVKGVNLPARVLVGSAVSGFGCGGGGKVSGTSAAGAARSTLINGSKYFIAETCEYRRHFLAFQPRRIVLTSVESDHQDYFPTYAAIRDAFLEYGRKLPEGGELIYCADDRGASEVAETLNKEARSGAGRDIRFIPYGFSAEGAFRISDYRVVDERVWFRLAGFPAPLALRIPGRHSALNATAALALCTSLVNAEGGWTDATRQAALKALEDFKGSKRRSEIIGTAGGVLFMDDYGHHPTAIRTTLEGLKAFYPMRRLIVSFMSHTYTRTAALLDEFASALGVADVVFLHNIYASAREAYTGGVNGRTLFERTRALTAPEKRDNVYYVEEYADAAAPLKALLRDGDLFLTLGAGDNWPLGQTLLTYYKEKTL
jgi:UDP-N-acetylmuramate--alanine ligase